MVDASTTPILGADARMAEYRKQRAIMFQHFAIPDLTVMPEPNLSDVTAYIMSIVKMGVAGDTLPDPTDGQGEAG